MLKHAVTPLCRNIVKEWNFLLFPNVGARHCHFCNIYSIVKTEQRPVLKCLSCILLWPPVIL